MNTINTLAHCESGSNGETIPVPHVLASARLNNPARMDITMSKKIADAKMSDESVVAILDATETLGDQSATLDTVEMEAAQPMVYEAEMVELLAKEIAKLVEPTVLNPAIREFAELLVARACLDNIKDAAGKAHKEFQAGQACLGVKVSNRGKGRVTMDSTVNAAKVALEQATAATTTAAMTGDITKIVEAAKLQAECNTAYVQALKTTRTSGSLRALELDYMDRANSGRKEFVVAALDDKIDAMVASVIDTVSASDAWDSPLLSEVRTAKLALTDLLVSERDAMATIAGPALEASAAYETARKAELALEADLADVVRQIEAIGTPESDETAERLDSLNARKAALTESHKAAKEAAVKAGNDKTAKVESGAAAAKKAFGIE